MIFIFGFKEMPIYLLEKSRSWRFNDIDESLDNFIPLNS